MSAIILSRDLTAAGIEFDEIRDRCRRGEYERLRRGAYVEPSTASPNERHRLLVDAAIALAQSDSVVSFGSAGLLHDLPVTRSQTARVHLTRIRNSSGRIRPGIHVHVAPLGPSEVSTVDDLPVTSLDRTFVDLARTSSLPHAVAIGDAALRRGLDVSATAAQLEQASRRRGIRTARRAAGMIDGLSESVGESFSRVIMIERGPACSRTPGGDHQ